MKWTPMKDKKFKPVFHAMAVVGAGYIAHVMPDILKLKLADMLRSTINHVSPTRQESQCAQLAFFIDRGYLELAQILGVKILNSIQVMESMRVKFLVMIKESKLFPFQIVDLKESNVAMVNGRPVVQVYGD